VACHQSIRSSIRSALSNPIRYFGTRADQLIPFLWPDKPTDVDGANAQMLMIAAPARGALKGDAHAIEDVSPEAIEDLQILLMVGSGVARDFRRLKRLPESSVTGVGKKPDSPSNMWRSNVGRSKHSPLNIEPEFGQV
jgi:hypothetical protein